MFLILALLGVLRVSVVIKVPKTIHHGDTENIKVDTKNGKTRFFKYPDFFGCGVGRAE